jgi:pyruvate,orthophosphate dikinase
VRFAVDAVEEGLLTTADAIATIDAGSLKALLHPTFAAGASYEVVARGVAASPGAAKGEIVFTAPAAVAAAEQGRDVILVRPFTEADDVAGFHAAKGILTSEGGKASHAALVARGMGRPAVTGAGDLEIDLHAGEVHVNGHVLHEGDLVAIDGTAGTITLDDVPLVIPTVDERFETVLKWCDELRTLSVRANADTPEDARRAHEFGAEGIGLCRTGAHVHGRRPQPEDAADDHGLRRGRPARRARGSCCRCSSPTSRGLFEEMAGQPVTIRLLDPPLHEFMPDRIELVEQVTEARLSGDPRLPELEHLLERVRALSEGNPMLGTRGVRLGPHPPGDLRDAGAGDLPGRQGRAGAHGRAPRVEIMVPLVAYAHELEIARKKILSVAVEEGFPHGHGFQLGTMIELPRACFRAGEIARFAEFFSFGTNDLTQTGLGFSRDDIEALVVPCYQDLGILERSPFQTIDEKGVGELVRHGGRARARRAAGPRGRHLRRARRRPAVDPLLPLGRPRLRQLLAVPRPDRPRRGRPGRDRGRSRRRVEGSLGRSDGDAPTSGRCSD